MRPHTIAGILLGGLTLGLLGCSGVTTSSGSAVSSTEPAGPIELKAVTGDEWDKVVESHKGKVVVVDVWAMTCAPCKAHFHEFVALSKKYPKGDVVCISFCVSLDPDEAVDQKSALEFLKSKTATVPNYCYVDKKPYNERFNIGGLPVCWVYGKNGKIAKTFTNDPAKPEFTYAQVEEEAKAQLAKP